MKRFKTFFYPIYIVVIVLVLLIALNIYDALELFKRWGWFKYFSDLPFMARDLLVFLAALMSIELIIENISIFGSRGKHRSLEQEIIELKAKLYDKSQEEQEEDAGEENDDDDDNEKDDS